MNPNDTSVAVERRGSRRREVDARVRIRLPEGESQLAQMIDVSATGVQLVMDACEGLESGQTVTLELLDTEGPPPAPRESRIVWHRVSDRLFLGLCFQDESAEPASININEVKIDPSVAIRFPAHRARRWQVLPFAIEEDRVLVAAGDDRAARAMTALERCFKRPIDVHAVDPVDLEAAIARVYAAVPSGSDERAMSIDVATIGEDTADAVMLYDQVLASAIVLGASDIHIDSFEQEVRVRVRVDGCLEPLRTIPVESGVSLISRIKVMAGLDIAERRAPQDGRLRHETETGLVLDIRVASLPTKQGERLTLRLLAQNTEGLTLESLGMSDEQLDLFSHAIRQPYGLVLLTGPTGSGKSTTLTAAIRQIIEESPLNVITIEDPVEYQIPGVTQVEVDQVEKVTFAKALRSALRHDPDVIMVGEIRDAETADIAVKAALTGHLVLSTLHTNDAAGAITRLRDMGVPPYLTAATLRLVVAQRLVRRLCTRCSTPVPCDPNHAAALGRRHFANETVYESAGCVYCAGRGYTGRLALFEMAPTDRGLAGLIANQADEQVITDHLAQRGVATLAEDAAAKVLDGRTSMAEAMRNVVAYADATTEDRS